MDAFSQLEKRRFWILVIIVSISGFSQGMLLPLISAIFEKDGISSSMNGLNATGSKQHRDITRFTFYGGTAPAFWL